MSECTALSEGAAGSAEYMADQPLVSVIVPAYNASTFIRSTLESILRQTYRRLEVLVVDDGSQDDTAAIVASYAELDDRIVLLRQRNGGVAAARNVAIHHASGEYIAPIDADDLWHPEKIERQVMRMQEGGPAVGLVYAWFRLIDEHGQDTSRGHPWGVEGAVPDALLAMNFIGCASVPLIRRSCLNVVEGYDPAFLRNEAQGCEDWDLTLRIAERFEVRVVPEYLVAYRSVGGSMSSDAAVMMRSHAQMLTKLRRRRPDVSQKLLRWSRGQMYGHFAARAFRSGLYMRCFDWLLRGLASPNVSFLSPLVVERVLRRGTAPNSAVHPDLPPVSPLGSATGIANATQPSGRRAARAGVLMIVSNIIQLAVAAGAVAALARLLVPADFGLFAMGAILLGLVATFRDFGLPAATLQKGEIRDVEVSALFWLNLKLNVVLSLCMAATAPVLAWFFGRSEVVAITLMLTAGGLVASVSSLHFALLGRGMQFGAVVAVELCAVIAGALAGIVSALLGAGYWSLVNQLVVTLVVFGTLPWLLCAWRPLSHRVSGNGRIDVVPLLEYGTSLSLSRVVTYAGQNLGIALVGRFAGAGALGLYQSAFRWATLPVHQVYAPLDQVVVSSLRPLRADVRRYSGAMISAIRATATLVLPFVAFIGVAAHDVVLLLLGRQWLGAVPIFQALAGAAFVDVARLSTKWLYLTEGRTDRQLRFTLASTPVMVLGMGVGVMWGALGVALGFASALVVLAYPTVTYCLATSPIAPRAFWGALARPAGAALFAFAIAVVALSALSGFALLPRLVGVGAVFSIGYAGAWLVAPGGIRAGGEVLALARMLWANSSQS